MGRFILDLCKSLVNELICHFKFNDKVPLSEKFKIDGLTNLILGG